MGDCNQPDCQKLPANKVFLKDAIECLNISACEDLNIILQIFANAICEAGDTQFCDIILDPKDAFQLIGTPLTFTSISGGTEIDTINVGSIALTRGDTGDIFNTITETSFTPGTSPGNTEWNSDFTDPILNGHLNLGDVQDRNYGNLESALNGDIVNNIISKQLIMHDLVQDKYYTFVFSSYDADLTGGAFSYIRQEIEIIEPCKIVFSDGSILNTAKSLVQGINNIIVTEEVTANGATNYIVDLRDNIIVTNALIENLESINLTSENVTANSVDTQELNVCNIVMSPGGTCSITFSDGSTMSTAPAASTPHIDNQQLSITPVLGGYQIDLTGDTPSSVVVPEVVIPPPTVNTNTWDMDFVAFVSPFGNDATAVLGDGNKPYQSIQTAQNVSNIVFLLPGNYSGTITLNSSTYYCYPGVKFISNSKLRDGGTLIVAKILGHAEFSAFSYGIETTSSSKIDVECDSFNNVRVVAFCLNTSIPAEINIKCRTIFSNNLNGGAYACTSRGGSKIIIECDTWKSFNWLCSFKINTSGVAGEFNLNCPNVEILDGGYYGNVGKSLFNADNISTDINVNINLMDGKYINSALLQSISFGVIESALLFYAQNVNNQDHKFIFKNGTVYANNQFGLVHPYIVTAGVIELENIKLISNTRALNIYLFSYAGNGNRTLHKFKNCKFESFLPSSIGNSQECYFEDCTFKVTGPAETSIIDYNIINPLDKRIIYFSNCKGELSNPNVNTGEFLSNEMVGAIMGAVDTYSTEVLGVGVVDTWGGYTQINTLKVTDI